MKNKKAFTLVELLGVIVVLAILALITIPSISNVINDVRIKSLQNSAYGLIEASNLYYAQYGVNNNTRFNITGSKVESSDTDKLLTYKGSVKEGTVILDRKGNVTVCITDGKNSAYKNYNESKVTTVKGKCEIFEGSSIVYLDDVATIDELSLAELTEKVLNLENSTLKIDDIYPVGSVYISTIDDTVEKVQNRFGGTWQVYGEGKTLVGYKSGDSDYTINHEGGNKTVTLNSNQIPTLSVSGNTVATTASNAALENGGHSHTLNAYDSNGVTNHTHGKTGAGVSGMPSSAYSYGAIGTSTTGAHAHNVSIPSLTVEASYRNDNQTNVDVRDPYITVYMYKRVS